MAQSTKMFCMTLYFAFVISLCHCKPIAFFSNTTFINKIQNNRIVPVLKNVRQVIALAVDVKRGHIYFSVTEEREKAIRRVSIFGGELTDIINEDIGTCEGLSIEWRSRLLYWTDASYKWIQVSWLDGSHRKVLIARDLWEPRGIAVDPSTGFMFWTDWNVSRIERADLDGNNRTLIVDKDIGWPNEIVIDHRRKKLYWTDSKLSRIDSADFNGNNRKTIFEQRGLHPYGISLVNDLVYWSDWASQGIHGVNATSGSLQVSYNRIGQLPMGLTIYDISRQQPGRNPCQKQKGNCEYLCLPTPYGYSCVCPGTKKKQLHEQECRISYCPKLKSPAHGSMFACASRSGSTCRFSCRNEDGFRLEGSRVRTCLRNGTWTGKPAYCKDMQPLRIQCPQSIVTNTPPGLDSATVFWVVPRPSGNFPRQELSLYTIHPRGITPPHTFPIGQNTITYYAEDKKKRKGYCFFTVTVKDREPPTLVSCPKDVRLVSDTKYTTLILPEVRFTDNDKVERVIASMHNQSEVTWGTYDVNFTASDPSGNTAKCAFKLRIFSKKCKISNPVNGRKLCDSTKNGGMTCTIQCKPGFAFVDSFYRKYNCLSNGKWINVRYMNGKPKLPDCSKTSQPHKMKLDGQVIYQMDDCHNSLNLNRNKEIIMADFKRNLQFCIGDKCTIENTSMNCATTKARRDTTSGNLYVTFAIFMKLEPKENFSALNKFSNSIISNIKQSLDLGELDIILGVQRLQADRRQGLKVLRKEPVCCDGQMFRDGVCINCPPGSFYEEINRTCSYCPPDTFQRRESQTACDPCPGKRSTWKMYGARSLTDCRVCEDKKRETRLGLCKSWLESEKGNYCKRDREIMYELCPKSCGVCGLKPTPSGSTAKEDAYTTATTIIIPVLVVIMIACIVITRFVYVRRRELTNSNQPKVTSSRELGEKDYSDHDDDETATPISIDDELDKKTTTRSIQSQTDTDSSLIQLRSGSDVRVEHYKSADAAFPSATRKSSVIHSKLCESCEATLV